MTRFSDACQLLALAFPHGQWTSESTVNLALGGSPVRLAVTRSQKSTSIQLYAPVEGAPPVWLWLAGKKHVFIGAPTPRMNFGDPPFDAAIRSHGSPEGLIRSALTSSLRQAVLANLGDGIVKVEKAMVNIVVSARQATPAALVGLAGAAAQLSTGLSTGYQQLLAEATRTGGPGAAHALTASMTEQLQTVENRESRGSMVVLGCVLVFLVVVLGGAGMLFFGAFKGIG